MNTFNHKATIIFIDDDEIYLRVLGKYFELQSPEYKVYAFHSGEECLAKLTDINPDAIIVDYHLQRSGNAIQGAELFKEIREKAAEVKILVMSGREPEEMKRELADSDVDGFVLKDMNSLPELRKRLQSYFD